MESSCMKVRPGGIGGGFPSKQVPEEIRGNVTADLNRCKEIFIRDDIPGHI
jgi:hypothetical protein